MVKKNFRDENKTLSSERYGNKQQDVASNDRLIITHIDVAGTVSISGTGCDKGWNVLIITYLGKKDCYLNSYLASPDANGNWNVRKSYGGHQMGLWWNSIYAISVREKDVAFLYSLFEEYPIEGIIELEKIFQQKKVPYKLAFNELPTNWRKVKDS